MLVAALPPHSAERLRLSGTSPLFVEAVPQLEAQHPVTLKDSTVRHNLTALCGCEAAQAGIDFF